MCLPADVDMTLFTRYCNLMLMYIMFNFNFSDRDEKERERVAKANTDQTPPALLSAVLGYVLLCVCVSKKQSV